MLDELKCGGYDTAGPSNNYGGIDIISHPCPTNEIIKAEGWYIECFDECIRCPKCLKLDELINKIRKGSIIRIRG